MSARKQEVDAARRRTIARTIERRVTHPSDRRVANQLATTLPLLVGDELEVLDHVIAHLHCDLWSTAAVVARLLRGRAEYGELVIDDDPRDFGAERDEELADAELCAAMGAIKARRNGDTARPKARAGVDALRRVGMRIANQLDGLAKRALERKS